MPRKPITREDFEWFFREADSNHDGYLSFQELKDVLKSYDYRGTDGDIRYMFTVTDSNSDDRISFEEFMEAMGQFPERLYLNMILLRIFRKFDANNDGQVTRDEFMAAANELGRHITADQVEEIIEAANMDQSKSLNYNEFAKEVYGIWGRCDILDMFFHEADTNNDEYLAIDELIDIMRKLGYTGSNVKIKEQFDHIDTSGDERISYEEFMMGMGVAPDTGYVDKSALMRRIFQQFDKDKNGKIDEAEMSTALSELGKHFTDRQVRQIMKQADKDNSGGLDYEEFIEHVQELFQNQDAFERFFREADVNNDNMLTAEELEDTLRTHGYGGSEAQIRRMFSDADESGDGKISFEEYMVCMGRQPQEVHNAAIMRRIFHDFDKNGDGRIDHDELKAVFREMGTKMSRRKVKKLMKVVDKDGSGSLDYEEFIHAITKNGL